MDVMDATEVKPAQRCAVCHRERPTAEVGIFRRKVSSTVTCYAPFCLDDPSCEHGAADVTLAWADRIAGPSCRHA